MTENGNGFKKTQYYEYIGLNFESCFFSIIRVAKDNSMVSEKLTQNGLCKTQNPLNI